MRKTILWILLLGIVCQRPATTYAQTGSATPPACSTTQATPKWTAVLTAHPDDWQLFMGAAVCEEVRHTRRKIVFICLTGGQANEPADAYWQSREAGHRASVRQAADLATPAASIVPAVTRLVINGHSLDVYRYQNTVAYYLHLPDGGVHGRGLARGNFQSLQQLREYGRPLTPLNGGAPYVSWNDLSQTIRGLLAREAIKGQLTLHIPQAEARCNPGDHSDHYLAGALAQHAMQQQECRFFKYVGYDVSRRPVNLTASQQNTQRQVYKAYCQTMVEQRQGDPWDAKHLAFIGHQYVQVKHQTGQVLQPERPVVASSISDEEVAKDEDALLGEKLNLLPNYPNPFAQSSLLVYQLPLPAAVWLRVLDMQGREILLLQNGTIQTAGQHEVWLDVQRFPAAGTYITELRVGHHRRLRTVSVVR